MTDTQTFHDERNPMILSYSGLASYLTCRHRWKLQNVYGVKTALGTRAMEVGTAVHEAVAFWLAMEGPIEDGIERWRDRMLAAIPEDDEPLGPSFATWEDSIWEYASDAFEIAQLVAKEIERLNLTPVYNCDGKLIIEREVSVPMPGWDAFAGHIDALLYEPSTDLYWIVDFKTRTSFYGDETEEVNLQNALYQYLGTSLGIDIAGSLTFQVKSTIPKRPKVNKDGTISRAKIATTWSIYKDAVIDAGGNPDDYLDMKAQLDAVEWVNLIRHYRSGEQLSAIWTKIVEPLASEMALSRDRLLSVSRKDRVRGMIQTPRNLSPRTCAGCSVRDICLAGLKGYDVGDVARTRRIRERDAFERAVQDGHL